MHRGNLHWKSALHARTAGMVVGVLLGSTWCIARPGTVCLRGMDHYDFVSCDGIMCEHARDCIEVSHIMGNEERWQNNMVADGREFYTCDGGS